ncbi:uncharacterized protein OCT59_026025 [Rhizophagus irregularis]|uniref:uncharacterized protein n=1 Tax=Rhizophagus irregularis TaxID=588596 RepID=UPI003331965B|nr:hypothetical protein OCT59_026025 [Rhizophagus irregularis]
MVIEMEKSYNCLLLGNNNILFPLAIFKDEVGKDHLCREKKVANSDNMILWKTNNVKMSDIKDRNISTEDDVKNELNGKKWNLIHCLEDILKN